MVVVMVMVVVDSFDIPAQISINGGDKTIVTPNFKKFTKHNYKINKKDKVGIDKVKYFIN
ncbi:MAG: hypothetical protein HRT66_13180 [Flavobacteriaceae bacterium]|nr:hypothetical protein [Flavobacteriaceae bacterium]